MCSDHAGISAGARALVPWLVPLWCRLFGALVPGWSLDGATSFNSTALVPQLVDGAGCLVRKCRCRLCMRLSSQFGPHAVPPVISAAPPYSAAWSPVVCQMPPVVWCLSSRVVPRWRCQLFGAEVSVGV